MALDSFKINNSPERCAINCDLVYSNSHYWGQVGNCVKDDVYFDFHPCFSPIFFLMLFKKYVLSSLSSPGTVSGNLQPALSVRHDSLVAFPHDGLIDHIRQRNDIENRHMGLLLN